MKPATLILETGRAFTGSSPVWLEKPISGEVVFSTGMTGYLETLTDPSYQGQILCFTYPLIGNYGVPSPEFWESKKIHAFGVIMNQACTNWNHHAGLHSIQEWLEKQHIPYIVGIDTRALTKTLREAGSMLGAILPAGHTQESFFNPNAADLVGQVTHPRKEILSHSAARKKIVVIDCGMKENILRALQKFPIEIHRVPYNHDFTHEAFDGIFISNGPGDPGMCAQTISILKKAMLQEKPIFGICLGTQLLGLAGGAACRKLLYGHRGHNQPCIDVANHRCYITSQNHGYAIDEKSLPAEWQITFRNLNDGSVEGIAHRELPFFAVQFHPEAAPGPTDTYWLFEKFYQLL